jgi:hypothetical protein
MPKKETKPKFNWLSLLLGWFYILLAAGVLYFLIERAQPERQLVCSNQAHYNPLTGFGSCHEE